MKRIIRKARFAASAVCTLLLLTAAWKLTAADAREKTDSLPALDIVIRPSGDRVAYAVPTDGNILPDGTMTPGEGWENTEWVELVCASNSQDTVKVKFLYDDAYLYFYLTVRNALWAGTPNVAYPETSAWLDVLNGDGGDNFGFSVLVDETGNAAARSSWKTVSGVSGDGTSLEKTCTTWCNRYRYTRCRIMTDEENNGNLGERCSLYHFDGHHPLRCPNCRRFCTAADALRAAGFSELPAAGDDEQTYIFSLDTQGGAGRYRTNGSDLNFDGDGYPRAINAIDEIRPAGLCTDPDDPTVHYFEGRIHWVTDDIRAGRVMRLEMKFGCGDDAWYFNCDPMGPYETNDPIGDGFQIYKAHTQWGMLRLVDRRTESETAPSTSDTLPVAAVLFAASFCLLLFRRRMRGD